MNARLEIHHLVYEFTSRVMMKTTRHFHICVKWQKKQKREGEIISLKKNKKAATKVINLNSQRALSNQLLYYTFCFMCAATATVSASATVHTSAGIRTKYIGIHSGRDAMRCRGCSKDENNVEE